MAQRGSAEWSSNPGARPSVEIELSAVSGNENGALPPQPRPQEHTQGDPRTSPLEVLRRVFWLMICFGLARATIGITVLSASNAQNQIHEGLGDLQTLSVGLSFLGQAMSPPFAAQIMAKLGRLRGIIAGCCIGVVAALVAFSGVYTANTHGAYGGQLFGLLLGSFLGGSAMSFANQFRFAASELVPERTPMAIGFVLAGGDLAALVGPLIVIWTTNALPEPWSANYLGSAALFFLCAVCINFVPWHLHAGNRSTNTTPQSQNGGSGGDGDGDGNGDDENNADTDTDAGTRPSSAALTSIPAGAEEKQENDAPALARPLCVILRQPRVVCAILCATIAYSMMVFLMVLFPIVMPEEYGFSEAEAAHTYQAHSVGMFSPPLLITPWLNRPGRFKAGQLNTIGLGFAVFIIANVLMIFDQSYAAFTVGMLLVGVGWNLVFIASTSMLITTHTTSEKAKVQGVNDSFVWGVTAIGAVFSRTIERGLGGWQEANELSLFLCVAGVIVVICMKLFDPVSRSKRDERARRAMPTHGLYVDVH